MKKKQILAFIEDINTPCKTSEIAIRFDMSTYQARHYLLCLEKEGKIRRTPLRRGASTLWMELRNTSTK
ncbi:FaeA/PapI family transcriptional regulator [Escherichia marmotae]|nr:FaeA/PapI family transcriptional regulator [Escherichia marmotae]